MNGIYQILNHANCTLNVYCDFKAEPGAAWTLVQSYSLEKGKRDWASDIFSRKSLSQDFQVNQYLPIVWSEYRLSLADMQSIRDQSTHWRATCEFPKNGVDFRDYLRASLEDFDIMDNHTHPSGSFCMPYEFINIRGNQCIDCTALTNKFWILTPAIRSFQSKLVPCDFDGRPNGGVEGERNFGVYLFANPAFRCSATKNSTTQFWLGKI